MDSHHRHKNHYMPNSTMSVVYVCITNTSLASGLRLVKRSLEADTGDIDIIEEWYFHDKMQQTLADNAFVIAGTHMNYRCDEAS